MKLSYKSAWKIRQALLTVGLAIMCGAMFLQDDILSLIIGSLSFAFIIAGAAVYYIFGRCPACKAFLKSHKWRSFRLPPQCRECGYEIE